MEINFLVRLGSNSAVAIPEKSSNFLHPSTFKKKAGLRSKAVVEGSNPNLPEREGILAFVQGSSFSHLFCSSLL